MIQTSEERILGYKKALTEYNIPIDNSLISIQILNPMAAIMPLKIFYQKKHFQILFRC